MDAFSGSTIPLLYISFAVLVLVPLARLFPMPMVLFDNIRWVVAMAVAGCCLFIPHHSREI